MSRSEVGWLVAVGPSPGMDFGLTWFWVGWLVGVVRVFGGGGEDFGVFRSGAWSTGVYECVVGR